jgi:hypothetical protein
MIAPNYQCEAYMSSATESTAQYRFNQQTSGDVAPLMFEPGFQILNEIEADNRIFRLSAPVDVTVSIEDGLWINAAGPLSIFAVGDSRGEALRSFCDDFAVLWDEIACAPDDSLTGDAIRVKRALNVAVKCVTAK